MNYEYIAKSPCKINLHLDVHAKRADGYHSLTSIFQLISLEDLLYAKPNSSGKIILIGEFDCKKEDNLIYKAAVEFYKLSNIKRGIEIRVEKKIPSGGGVGGGSSNCATTLRLLNYIYCDVLTKKQLFNIGLSLGSDVPFFLGTGTSLVQGRGEIVSSINPILDYTVLIINPSIHISTKEAFEKLNKRNVLTEENSKKTEEILKEYSKGVNNFSIFKNSFEIALNSDYTFINSIKTGMLAEGALYAALSGSGSTMFGLFKSEIDAENAKRKLSSNSLYKIFIVKPLEDFPKIEKRNF